METNPDLVRLRAFLADPARSVAFDTNPLLAALGARLDRSEPEASLLGMSFAPSRLFVQGAGFVQGGAVGCMLDFVMAFAAFARLPAEAACSTVSLTTSLLAGVRGGAVLRAEGVSERAGRSLVFTRAELRTADAILVASATSVLAVRCGAPVAVAPIPT